MSLITVRCFDAEESAKSFFDNAVRESKYVDGIRFKGAHYLASQRNELDPLDIENGDDVYVVVIYPAGMAFEIDTFQPEPGEENGDE